jgi:hypothetical protein
MDTDIQVVMEMDMNTDMNMSFNVNMKMNVDMIKIIKSNRSLLLNIL